MKLGSVAVGWVAVVLSPTQTCSMAVALGRFTSTSFIQVEMLYSPWSLSLISLLVLKKRRYRSVISSAGTPVKRR